MPAHLGVAVAHPLHAVPQSSALIVRRCPAAFLFLRAWLAIAKRDHANKAMLLDGALLTLFSRHHPEFLQEPSHIKALARARHTPLPLAAFTSAEPGAALPALPLPHSFVKLMDARALASKLPNHAGPDDLSVCVGPFASFASQRAVLTAFATQHHPELLQAAAAGAAPAALAPAAPNLNPHLSAAEAMRQRDTVARQAALDRSFQSKVDSQQHKAVKALKEAAAKAANHRPVHVAVPTLPLSQPGKPLFVPVQTTPAPDPLVHSTAQCPVGCVFFSILVCLTACCWRLAFVWPGATNA